MMGLFTEVAELCSEQNDGPGALCFCTTYLHDGLCYHLENWGLKAVSTSHCRNSKTDGHLLKEKQKMEGSELYLRLGE